MGEKKMSEEFNDKHVTNPSVEPPTECPEDTEGALSALLHKLAFEDFSMLEKTMFTDDDTCTCQSCNERRAIAKGTLEELKMIQSCWLELRQYIRAVYWHSMKGSLKTMEDIDYLVYMKDIVARLCEVCNPHQLYQRLEAQVREFVVEVKVRLLQLMDRLADNPQLPRLFISGMLDRYNKMMDAANEISPVLKQLEVDHLSKFNLTWKVLNQRLFQTSIYTDLFFQNSVPLFITQLSSEENKLLVREFLSFDDEITLVEGMWTDVEERINQYTQNQATTLGKQRFLKDEWLEFKTIRRSKGKVCHKNISTSDKNSDSLTEASNSDNQDGNNTSIQQRLSISSSNEPTMAPDDCQCHLCQDPAMHTTVEYLDHVLPLKAPSGFHLYRHIHGTGDGSVDKATQKDQDVISNLNEFIRLSDEQLKIASVTSRSTKDTGTDTNSQIHHPHCNKHSDTIKRVPCVEPDDENNLLNGNEDSHSDVSQSDPRHCDCCYCEVFGHGLPAAAPMSRNYQEMRERLRILLNKKKSKCKSSSNMSPSSAPAPQKKQQVPINNTEMERDTRALEDLIEYIEGTEVKCRNEKKAAKKARQKEKKRILLIRKKNEEEERARMIEEMERRKREEEEAAALREKEEREAALLRAQQSKAGKRKGKKRSPLIDTTRANKTEVTSPGPQMVTIKRVMEPHNSEPTVTITLRGATPNQDRVLYTLLNGQVCKVKDAENNAVKGGAKGRNLSSGNHSVDIHQCNSNMNSGKKSKKKDSYNSVNISSHHLNVNNPSAGGIRTLSQGVTFSTGIPMCTGSDSINNEPAPIPRAEGSVKIQAGKGLTNPTSIQINNAINSLSRPHSFNIDDIKLPPGITITKVDPLVSNGNRHPTLENEEETLKKIASSAKLKTPPSEVIVVATNKLKDFAQNRGFEPDIGTEMPPPRGKKKNKRREIHPTVYEMNESGYPGLEIEPIALSPLSVPQPGHNSHHSQSDLVNRMSVLTISPYDNKEPTVSTIKVPQPDVELRQLRSTIPSVQQQNQQRSQQNHHQQQQQQHSHHLQQQHLHQQQQQQQQQQHNHQQQLQPQQQQATSTSLNAENSKRKKKKTKKSQSNTNLNPDEWNLLDSVFAPKDIDLNDGEIDDAERELEAFKRFCLQSVPPKRKEKVHLNIKDIVLKKKSTSSIPCS